MDLPDYSGPFRPDLRFTDFSKEALLKMIEMNIEYRRVWVGAWFEEAEGRFGRDERLDLEWLAWRDGMVPKLEAMLREYLPSEYAEARLEEADLGRFVGDRPDIDDLGIDYDGPFASDPKMLELSKEQLVSIILGSHEYILQCNQGFSMQIVVRHGFGDMFAIAWDIWSAKVLPAVMDLKARNMGIDGNDVAAFMKDLQIDCQALQPEHEDGHPRHSAAARRQPRLLQVEAQHAGRERSRVRRGRADYQEGRGLRPTRRRASRRVTSLRMPNEIDSLLFADATAQAEEIRSALPPFLGVSVSFKDVVDVAGVVTTHSCKLLADDVAEADSPIVRRFRAAGLVVLGKTNTPEFCTTIGSHGRARTGLRQGGET